MSKINLTVIGHLGHSCTVKHLDGGNTVINFSVASTRKYTDKSGTKHEKTTWVDCSLWRNTDKIGIADYLKRGQLVCVEGIPESRGWASKADSAVINSAIMLNVKDLILLGKRNEDSASTAAEPSQDVKPAADETVSQTESAGDDLPF